MKDYFKFPTEGAPMQIRRILIVDEDSNVRTNLFRALDRKSFQVVTASNLNEAFALCKSASQIDLVIYDLAVCGKEPFSIVNVFKTMGRSSAFIAMMNHANLDIALQASQNSVSKILQKPFDIADLFKAIENLNKTTSIDMHAKALQEKYKFENIVGQSPELMKAIEMVDKVANSDSTVLITGESGTGKELFARAIHFNSDRSEKPLVPVNCGAIPGELLESELFGHIKGAFTGAIANRIGRFEMANQGSLFLDEIGDMSANLQVKLLRVLQEQRFEAVGSAKSIDVDVRVIAATNIDLEKAVEEGRFREDLFYRLNVIPIRVPALRERTGDIPMLIHHFMQKFNLEKNRQVEGITPEAMDLLKNYAWPGNVRELENLMERMSIVKSKGIIAIEDLPEKYTRNQASALLSRDMHSNIHIPNSQIPLEGVDFNSAVDAFENSLIMQALEKTNWNRNQAAKLLRLNRTTLVEKMKKKGLRDLDM